MTVESIFVIFPLFAIFFYYLVCLYSSTMLVFFYHFKISSLFFRTLYSRFFKMVVKRFSRVLSEWVGRFVSLHIIIYTVECRPADVLLLNN